jgi:hypothetical protein
MLVKSERNYRITTDRKSTGNSFFVILKSNFQILDLFFIFTIQISSTKYMNLSQTNAFFVLRIRKKYTSLSLTIPKVSPWGNLEGLPFYFINPFKPN